MNAAVDIAILQLHAESERKTLRSLFELPNNADPVFHVTHVVVGHLINEQWSLLQILHKCSSVSLSNQSILPSGNRTNVRSRLAVVEVAHPMIGLDGAVSRGKQHGNPVLA